ncbi:Deoxyribonuclease Tat-D [Neolecta irregularis DAH-3]|uniref:Deoxyribonuclease Tat-D n=1 Tax=Neolecta irregularis (strain DAH-3) TaxID=1198029 RepID=A0A1U7LK28_NEOID|nr:Deoxyribonuclease Tat-D [Neolecta irregularis DAH-3]|eukprot:OLL23010.1 Deoxyribonuclease Tat-D [Neolecta irregularis DAH-3]
MFIDIGFNATDPAFNGQSRDSGKQYHPADLDSVISRAQTFGVKHFMLTGGDLQDSRNAMLLAAKYPQTAMATVGCHPTRCSQFDNYPHGPLQYLKQLEILATQGKQQGLVCAWGELGLDYDRLNWCDKETQKKYFEMQLDAAERLDLPLFLHSRAAADDFEALLFARLHRLKGGVVHSFTGTAQELNRILSHPKLCVSVNACSLKTVENIDMVKQIPLDRIMLETDSPWCQVRKSHASWKYLKDAPLLPKAVDKKRFATDYMVRSRNEPCAIWHPPFQFTILTTSHIAHIVAAIKNISLDQLSQAAFNNSARMFGFIR